MSSAPRLDCVGLSGLIISSDSYALSPSIRSAGPELCFPIPETATSQLHIVGETTTSEDVTISEREPLLKDNFRPTKKPFYRPRPLWYVPFNCCHMSRGCGYSTAGRARQRLNYEIRCATSLSTYINQANGFADTNLSSGSSPSLF
jgi:hypothetical protein